jgi:integrase
MCGHSADILAEPMADKLSDKLVRALPSPTSGNRITYDTEIRGFGLRITAKGARAFVLNYRVGGRERRYTIGAYPDWSVAAAREEAKRLKRLVDHGHDPMGERHAYRAVPIVADLAARYLEEYAARKVPRAQKDDRAMLEKLVLPAIGQIKVHEVRREDIDRLHREVSLTRPVRANRMAQLLSKMFNLAIRWEFRIDNPVKGLHRNPENKRTRYLSGDELRRLFSVLATHPNQLSANLIRFLLLTGARRGEAMTATWEQFDLEAGTWAKPSAHTKQKKEHRVPLSGPARQLLSEMNAKSGASPFVFPGRVPGEPLTDIKNFWAGVCKQADIRDCRVHDLRHTYASILASAGLSLPVIGALLGHTQPNTTARYSHLFDDPLRDATQRVGSLLEGLNSDTAAEVLRLGNSKP